MTTPQPEPHQPAYIRAHGPLEVPLRVIRLQSHIATLQAERAWREGDRVAQTLVKEGGLRVVLTLMRAGARLQPHATAGAVTIHCVQGRLRLLSPGHTGDLSHSVELIAGELAALDTGLPHTVEAIADCAFLVTIAQQSHATSEQP